MNMSFQISQRRPRLRASLVVPPLCSSSHLVAIVLVDALHYQVNTYNPELIDRV